MATLCCDAVAEGLRRIKPTSAIDIREGFHMQRNMLHTVLKLHHRITTGLVTTKGPALGTALGPAALEVVMAGFEATMGLQEAVLCPEALTSGLGELTRLSYKCTSDCRSSAMAAYLHHEALLIVLQVLSCVVRQSHQACLHISSMLGVRCWECQHCEKLCCAYRWT